MACPSSVTARFGQNGRNFAEEGNPTHWLISTGINSFFSYIYIAFFKQLQANRAILQPFPGSYGCKGTCMSELNKQLQAIFISKVVLANVKEIMIPHFWWKKDRIQEQRRAELDEMAKQERLDE